MIPQIISDKFVLSWDKWKNEDLVSFQLKIIENKCYNYEGIGYESCIYEKSKQDGYTVYDFICQCYLKVYAGYASISDLIDREDNALKYKNLSEKEFAESINEMQFKIRFWDKPILKRLPKEKISDILVIYEWWDSSDYIIEYEDRWVYLNLAINY